MHSSSYRIYTNGKIFKVQTMDSVHLGAYVWTTIYQYADLRSARAKLKYLNLPWKVVK